MSFTDHTSATDAEWQARVGRFEAGEQAEEAFDAIGTLRRVRLLMESLDRQEVGTEPLPDDKRAWSEGFVASSHVTAQYLRDILEDSDPFWGPR